MQRNQAFTGDLRGGVDPGQRSWMAWNPYPPDPQGTHTEGFYTAEQWGAQYRGQWAIAPVTENLASGASGTQTLTWAYDPVISPGTGIAVVYNGTDTSITWTPTWVLTVDGTEYDIPLSDVSPITTAAGAGARAIITAPVMGTTPFHWSLALSGTLGAAGSVWAGLLYW